MLSNSNFLCEIGTEELPAAYIPPIINVSKDIFKTKLEEERITFSDIEVLATPRRLAIFISGLAESQNADEVEVKGPPVKAAYDQEGNPTKALNGFLKGNKSSISDVFTKETAKGEYIFLTKQLESKNTSEILPSIIEHLIKTIPSPKKMRWSDKEILFPRPIKYFLILFNNNVIDINISGIKSGSLTRGHYIQSDEMIEVKNIKDYVDVLLQNNIILNHNERREFIKNKLSETAAELGGSLVEDEELLDTVTFLIEKPYIVTCEFSESFLEIPDIVLITEMREHQKYFAVNDSSGKLMSKFLVVSNNPPTEFIKKGNEKVVTARFSDAVFFFNEDREVRLSDRVEELKKVLFHKDLGTIFDKTQRMCYIAEYISNQLNIDKEIFTKIERAINLCKTDLVTKMVIEFSSLQGRIGRIYALLDGEDEEIANAISDHYKPRFHGDEPPKNIVSIILSISEKLDNIFGSFSVGSIPKGSEDPYALRRQSNSILETLIENEINLSLDNVLTHISNKYQDGNKLINKILKFISARAKTIFQDKGYRYDEIDACLSINFFDYLELNRRAESIHSFRKSKDFSGMLLCFKRMNSILSIFLQKNENYKLQFNQNLLSENSEKDLWEFVASKNEKINEYINTNQYTELFKLLIEGKEVIDHFFDNVMVMADDTSLRDNRLALLEKILNPFKNLLDFSKISD